MELETINRLFLELSQVATAKTKRELDLETAIGKLNSSLGWYKKRCDLLKSAQSKFRDPERAMVCDILANGSLLPDETGSRYGLPEITDTDRLNFLLEFITLGQGIYDHDGAPPLGPCVNDFDLVSDLENEGLFKAIETETGYLDSVPISFEKLKEGWQRRCILEGIDHEIREER